MVTPNERRATPHRGQWDCNPRCAWSGKKMAAIAATGDFEIGSRYWQGTQRGSWRLRALPEGTSHKACGVVATLANRATITGEPRLATDLVGHAEL